MTYSKEPNKSLAVHTGRLKRSGSTVTGWFRTTMTPPGDDGVAQLDVKEEFDCASHRGRAFAATGRDANGKVVLTGPGDGKWLEIEPETIASTARDYACDHPPFFGWIAYTIAAEDYLRESDDPKLRGLAVTHVLPSTRNGSIVRRWAQWASGNRVLMEYNCKGRMLRRAYEGGLRVANPEWIQVDPGTIGEAIVADACGRPAR